MSKFTELYESFEEMYDSMLRGNEIQFSYNGKSYYLLPCFDENEKVESVYLGLAYTDFEEKYSSMHELYNARIDDSVLGEILPKAEIIWHDV